MSGILLGWRGGEEASFIEDRLLSMEFFHSNRILGIILIKVSDGFKPTSRCSSHYTELPSPSS